MSQHTEVTGAQLVERARALGPKLIERRVETERSGAVPVETIQEMQEAGLFRALQPKRWGGYEVHPNDYFDIEIELGKYCPSTAWIYGVIGVHAWQLAVFADKAQQEVWGDDTSTLISSSYMPVGKVQHAEGGYKLSGRWGFSSGSNHCDWVFLGAFVPPKEEGQRPDMRTFLVKKGEYRIEDNWDVSGLRGTSSNDIVIDEPVFIPEHRTHRFADGFKCESPGNKENTAPLYKIPFGQLFNRSVSTSSIGMLEGAVNAFIETQSKRVARGDGRKVASDPSLLEALADARATARELRAVLTQSMNTLMDYAEQGKVPTIEERVAFRYDSSRVAGKCRQAVLNLFAAGGGGAAWKSHPLQPYTQALLVARQHHANNPEKPGQNYANVSMGANTSDFFI